MSEERKKYLRSIKINNFLVFGSQILILGTFLILWEVLANKGVIDSFITDIYTKSKELLKDAFDKVNKLDSFSRSKNTATNDLVIIDNGVEMKFDCYIQEYDNIPSLFTVEVEKYVKELK